MKLKLLTALAVQVLVLSFAYSPANAKSCFTDNNAEQKSAQEPQTYRVYDIYGNDVSRSQAASNPRKGVNTKKVRGVSTSNGFR